jgi:hypothetical protein
MDGKMKGMIMAGMMGLSLILGLMAVLGGSWLTSDEFMGEELEGDAEVTYGLNALNIVSPDADCSDEMVEFVEEAYTGMEAECDGDTLSGTWAMSDQCDFWTETLDDASDSAGDSQAEVEGLKPLADAKDDACDSATAGTMGTIGMWGGVVCALLAVLILVLPMAGVNALDAVPDVAKTIVSWAAGGLMLLGILLWYMMLPDGDASAGMTLWMAIGAAVLGLGASAMDEFMPADE